MTTKSRYSADRIAQILADSDAIGDKPAAQKNGVSRQALTIWRKRMMTDAELRGLYEGLKKRQTDDWHVARRSALTAACERGFELAKTEKNLDKITRFIASIGGLDVTQVVQIGGLEVVRKALGGGPDTVHPTGSQPSDASASDGQEPLERAH